MSTYRATPYAEIETARRLRIQAGEKIRPKGECFFCAWEFQHKELFCSADCAASYHAEVRELAAPMV